MKKCFSSKMPYKSKTRNEMDEKVYSSKQDRMDVIWWVSKKEGKSKIFIHNPNVISACIEKNIFFKVVSNYPSLSLQY